LRAWHCTPTVPYSIEIQYVATHFEGLSGEPPAEAIQSSGGVLTAVLKLIAEDEEPFLIVCEPLADLTRLVVQHKASDTSHDSGEEAFNLCKMISTKVGEGKQ
jgi:hypothetical protein